MPWRGLDVGSPFAYRQQGILYVARALPPPGRDGLSEAALAEIAELVWAAGGRTLGLFCSRRAAETAAVHVRTQLPKLTILCQGDAQLSELTRRFIADEQASLFGTLSLWQGVDVPGATCQLVIIDRIPFPRPDEPLTMARQRAVAEAGGNGFMTVAATHAALLLAQGSGRLIRRLSDRGRGRRAGLAAGHRPVRHASCRPRCRTCGRPPTARWPSRRCAGCPARPSPSAPADAQLTGCRAASGRSPSSGRVGSWNTPTISTWP